MNGLFSLVQMVQIDFFARLNEKGLDVRSLRDAKIAAIGTATASKLKNYGIIADKVPTMFMGRRYF